MGLRMILANLELPVLNLQWDRANSLVRAFSAGVLSGVFILGDKTRKMLLIKGLYENMNPSLAK